MTKAILQQFWLILLKVPYQTNRHQFYQTHIATGKLTSFPSIKYPYIMIPHPSNNELTLGRVYTRDMNSLHLYVQHYVLVIDPIDRHLLKNTNWNASAKEVSKYSTTQSASMIRQCSSCIKKDDDALNQANQMARRNCWSKITCLFTQDTAVVTVLPMKRHQIY